MKVTKENLDKINCIYKDNRWIDNLFELTRGRDYLKSLLLDIDDLNKLLKDKDEAYRQIYIDWQDYHNKYSPERTDPCPDYYGTFTLRFEKNPNIVIGDRMSLLELDDAIYVLTNFTEFKLS